MKNVLLFVHDDPGQSARIQAALDLVRALDGHLSCLDIAVMPPVLDDLSGMTTGAMLLAEERTRERDNRTSVEAQIVREGVPYDWTDVTGDAAECLRDAAGLADIVVVSTGFDDRLFPSLGQITANLIVESRKPVLAVPREPTGLRLHGTALVAWDGSREAEAALRAAVPLLTLAERVVLLEVDDGSVRHPAEQAASYLARHGVEPRIERAAAPREGAAGVLLDNAASGRADWIVMGGFGHSRFVQSLFGGVSRRLIDESPVPLVLAH